MGEVTICAACGGHGNYSFQPALEGVTELDCGACNGKGWHRPPSPEDRTRYRRAMEAAVAAAIRGPANRKDLK